MVRYLGKAYHNIFSLPITALALPFPCFLQIKGKSRVDQGKSRAKGNRATEKNVKKLIKLVIKIIILIT
jgi:hypothetical protein